MKTGIASVIVIHSKGCGWGCVTALVFNSFKCRECVPQLPKSTSAFGCSSGADPALERPECFTSLLSVCWCFCADCGDLAKCSSSGGTTAFLWFELLAPSDHSDRGWTWIYFLLLSGADKNSQAASGDGFTVPGNRAPRAGAGECGKGLGRGENECRKKMPTLAKTFTYIFSSPWELSHGSWLCLCPCTWDGEGRCRQFFLSPVQSQVTHECFHGVMSLDISDC